MLQSGVYKKKDKPWCSFDVNGILAVLSEPITDLPLDVWCSVVGWCDPDDGVIPISGSDVLVAVVMGGELRATIHSVMKKCTVQNVYNLAEDSW